MFVDNTEMFCGRPYAVITMWHHNTEVGLGVRDNDDCDFGVVYKCKSKEEQETIFHELINYLYDLKCSIVNTESILDGSFFLDLGVKKVRW